MIFINNWQKRKSISFGTVGVLTKGKPSPSIDLNNIPRLEPYIRGDKHQQFEHGGWYSELCSCVRDANGTAAELNADGANAVAATEAVEVVQMLAQAVEELSAPATATESSDPRQATMSSADCGCIRKRSSASAHASENTETVSQVENEMDGRTFTSVPISDLITLQRRLTIHVLRSDDLIDKDDYARLNDKIGDFKCEQYEIVLADGHTSSVVRKTIDLARVFSGSDQQFATQLRRKVIQNISTN
jgi:hypothetical protein